MPKTAPLILFVLLATTATAAAASGTSTKTASSPAVVPVTAAQKDQAVEQYVQIRELGALGTHCSWLTPIEQQAVDISADERLAWLTWQKADLGMAKQKAAARVKDADSADCKPLTDKRKAVQFGAWQMRSSWALRGYSMLPIQGHPAWFAGKSTVAAHSTALETTFSKLLAYSSESVTASTQMFDQSTLHWLSVRCKATDKDCPARMTDQAERGYAEAIVKLTERYAAALEKVKDKAGIPSAPVTR